MDNIYFGILTGFSIGVLTGLYFKKFKNQNSLNIIEQIKAVSSHKSTKLVIVVRTDLNMGKGKIAAQCCHVTLSCYKKAQKKMPEILNIWESHGQPKVVVKLDMDGEEGLYKLVEEAKKLNIIGSVIHDAGHTQVAPSTATVAGIGPADADIINKVTGHLKLL